MKSVVKKIIVFIIIALILTLILPDGWVLADTESIKINSVDIGYSVGDFFTKDGKTCKTEAFSNGTCHKNNICVDSTNPNCNCMRYWPSMENCEIDLMATQCFGFARFCQWKLYGFHDGNNKSGFEDITGKISVANCTGIGLKAALYGCQPATHLRTGDNGHSMVVATTDNEGALIVSCNNGSECIVMEKYYTWEALATYLSSRGGVHYAKAIITKESHTHSFTLQNENEHPHRQYNYCECGYKEYTGLTLVLPDCTACNTQNDDSNNPDKFTYPTRLLKLTSPMLSGDDVRWVQSVLFRLGYDIDVDGYYGSNTVATVKIFQKDYGLSVDGQCGPLTCTKLKELWEAKISYIPGDINGDKAVTLNDVSVLAQYVAGWQGITFVPQALDVNGDGAVTLNDVSHLAQYVAGWENIILK